MLSINRLEPNRFYRVRDTIGLPFNKKDPMNGCLITVYSEDIQSTIDFFSRKNISFRNYTKYYLERRLFAEAPGGIMLKKVNRQKEIFDEGFGKNFPKVTLAQDPARLNKRNFIYELGQLSEVMSTNKVISRKNIFKKADVMFKIMFERLENINSDFASYNKFLIFPVDDYIENPNLPALWRRRDYIENYGVMFLRQIRTNWELFKNTLPGWKIIFINNNELFYINCSDLNDKTPALLMKLFAKMKSSKKVASIEECDDNDLTDDEDKNDEIIAKENIIKANKIIKDVSVKADELPVSDSTKEIIKKAAVEETKKAFVKTNSPKSVVTKTTLDEKPKEEPKPEVKEPVDVKKTLITNPVVEKEEEIKPSDKPVIKKLDVESIKDGVKEKVKNDLLDDGIPRTRAQLARITKAQQIQKDIKVDNMSLTELAIKAEQNKIPDYEISSSVINDKMKNIQFNNFEKGYNEKILDYDTMSILTSFSEKDHPLYLINFEKEDVSTVQDKIFMYHCIYEDSMQRRFTLNFKMPKFINDRFLFLNGSKKMFLMQIVPLPVTKVREDEVQVSSAYNKIFIKRFGRNVSNKISKFLKVITDSTYSSIKYIKGNNILDNSEFETSMEYDELAKNFMTISLVKKDITVYFNQKEAYELCERYELNINKEEEFPFAIQTLDGDEKRLFTVNNETGKIKISDDYELSPIDFILEFADDDKLNAQFDKAAGAKKTMYTRGKIMGKDVPIVLLLSFLIGLEPLLTKLKCNYKFTEDRHNIDNTKRGVVRFKDGYLSYDLAPYSNSLMLNGLYDIPTEEYNFFDMSIKDTYYDIFQTMLGRRNIGNAFDNFMQLFMDPITKEILRDYKLPQNFIDLMIYANTLLENNAHDRDGDLKNFRVRSNEMVNAHLYKVLSKAYEEYHMHFNDKKPKFSIRPDDVINDIYSSQVLEEVSTLNPILEIDRMRSTSYKGPGGCNLDDGFRMEKRAYNSSMLGVLGQSSPISGSVGISRVMSLNPNIKSLRGYIEAGDAVGDDKLDQSNMLSVAEMLVPMTATHDDPQRVGMTSTQSRHTLATMESDVPLFGYGTDKILSKIVSDEFAYKAKEDGFILEYNKELGYQIIKYKSGKTDVIDLTDKQGLNTGSGFYINNKLTPVYTTQGHKFKKGEVLAFNMQFFSKDELSGDIVYKSGPLARVAVMHGSFVYEDSTSVTESFAKKMGSYVTEMKDVRIGKNSNIYHIASIGDTVKVNDPLLIFDESYEDEFVNKLLSKMNEKEKEALINDTRSVVKSKWNGEIVDIKIYYTCPKAEMSETLEKTIKKYENTIRARRAAFENAGVNMKNMITLNDIDTMTPLVNGKIAGVKMEEFDVLIKFFIRTVDEFGTGDKMTFSTALKGIVQSMIPEGQEPYLVSDPSIKIDAMMGVTGFFARMTNSAGIALALNSVLMGAEKKIKDILEDKK